MRPDPVDHKGVDEAGLPEGVDEVRPELAALGQRARRDGDRHCCKHPGEQPERPVQGVII